MQKPREELYSAIFEKYRFERPKLLRTLGGADPFLAPAGDLAKLKRAHEEMELMALAYKRRDKTMIANRWRIGVLPVCQVIGMHVNGALAYFFILWNDGGPWGLSCSSGCPPTWCSWDEHQKNS